MRIGLDFDNTIVCYDELFHALALERGLIPASLPTTKSAVRNHLRSTGREEEWTRLQGLAYGARIGEAKPFPAAIEFVRALRRQRIPLAIISHKTQFPYLGDRVDLHQAALGWLTLHGFLAGPDRTAGTPPLTRGDVYFELTKHAKLKRIRQFGCTHFVDDLPEFLLEPSFPVDVTRVLFEPGASEATAPSQLLRVRSWSDLPAILNREVAA